MTENIENIEVKTRKNGPLVSVIIPVYNVKDYMDEAVVSAINQEYKDLEIIIVDDGSKDGSDLLCNSWECADERIRCIHQENEGLSSARNAGLDIAKGDYIAFLDSDDYMRADMIGTLVDILEKNRDCDIAMCGFKNFQTRADISYKNIFNDGVVDTREVNTFMRKLSYKELLMKSTLCKAPESIIATVAWNKLYRAELFKSNDLQKEPLRFKEGRLHEDEWMIHHFLTAPNVMFIDRDMYYYRVRIGSLMNSQHADFKSECDTIDAWIDRANTLWVSMPDITLMSLKNAWVMAQKLPVAQKLEKTAIIKDTAKNSLAFKPRMNFYAWTVKQSFEKN